MPFDSFMTASVAKELKDTLTGIKVDKVCQPEKDEIDLWFHLNSRKRLVINCTANTSYLALSGLNKENPPQPPNLCMLLRKHLSRAKITSVDQMGFDRVVRITFDAGDEMGFRRTKYLYCEMMGRGSNLIFVDEDEKILSAFRQNDVTTKFGRIVMVGARFTPMPLPDKKDPMALSISEFQTELSALDPDTPAEKAISLLFSGFGKLTAREAAYLASGSPDGTLKESKNLAEILFSVTERVRKGDYSPCLVFESKEAYEKGAGAIDFSFMPIAQYGKNAFVLPVETPSGAVESFYLRRDTAERRRQHYNDIYTILKNCKNRLEKKIAAQNQDLENAKDALEDKKRGELILQELYRLKKGDTSFTATDYSGETPKEIAVALDEKLSPSQNAQRYFRDYRKKMTAMEKMREQIELAENELDYVKSVTQTLQTAATQEDLYQIREELSHWSYGRRLTKGLKKPASRRPARAKPAEFSSPSGFRVLVGMNHLQNDTVTCEMSEKGDYWFHVKDYHGSHVLLKIPAGSEAKDEDLEFAASLAAHYSELSSSPRAAVDYTLARFVKKPSGAKPGFVTYKNQTTVFVKPESGK